MKKFLEYWRSKRMAKTVLVILGLALLYYALLFRLTLPSDEQMIAHFKAHKQEFEELVHRYRSFETGPTGDHLKWVEEAGTKDLLEQTQIERITYSGYSPWLPNPYSLESAKKMRELALGGKETFQFWYRYGGLMVQPAPFSAFRARNLRYGDIWKDYYHISEVPRIEDGYLLWPYNLKGEYSVRRRLLTSLDAFPENWKSFECVFKQIEIHWYLSMCNGR